MVRLWYRFCRLWCRAYFCTMHYGRVFNRHLVPSSGPLLFVSNHQSFFDPVLVGYGLDREVDYMARETLFRNASFTRLIRSLNAFPVKRGQVDISAIKETLRRLKRSRAVLMFPEATRTTDGRISPFKSGLAILARKANVPVIPVVIDGAYEAWPRTAVSPRPLVQINVLFGQAIEPAQFQADPDRIVEDIHRRMTAMQHTLRRMAGREPYEYDGQ